MIRRFLLSLMLATTVLTAAPLPAGATFNPFDGACTQNTKDSTACSSDANSDSVVKGGPKALMLNITNVVAIIAGALAVIMIIVGAFRFITAGSDVSTGSRTDTDVEDARRTITSSLLGLAVIILARTIIFYVIDKL